MQPVDHEGRAEVTCFGVQVRLAIGGTHPTDVGTADVMQVLRGDLALKDVLEVRRQPEVDVVEMRHIGDVVDDLAAIGTLDEHRVPVPVGPLIAGMFRDLGDTDLGLRRVAFVVVPDEQQARAHVGVPGPGAGQLRRPLGVGHQLAPTVAPPTPVVERAGHLVALDSALGQVPAHVSAVGIKYMKFVIGIGEHHQFGAERVDRMRLAIQEALDRSQTVPATGVAIGQGPGVDIANFGGHSAPPLCVSN